MVKKCSICGENNVYSIRKHQITVINLCQLHFEELIDVEVLEKLAKEGKMVKLKAALNGEI